MCHQCQGVPDNVFSFLSFPRPFNELSVELVRQRHQEHGPYLLFEWMTYNRPEGRNLAVQANVENPQIIQSLTRVRPGREPFVQEILQRILDLIFVHDLWFLTILNNPDATLIFRKLPGRPRLGETSMAAMRTDNMRHPFRTLSDLPAHAIPALE